MRLEAENCAKSGRNFEKTSRKMSQELSEDELQDLYAWIDKVPLSRTKRHISRDFSDGVMAAEVVNHFFPKLVDLHNYVPASSTPQKISNWSVLNRKVFSKLNFHVPEETVRKISLNTAGVIEPVLSALREKIDKKLENSALLCSGLEYFEHGNFEKSPTDIRQLKGEMNRDDKRRLQNGNQQFYTDMDPSFQMLLQEKEQAVMALQETVEILQIKLSKLEHLIHLKDMRIEELTRHLDLYKTKGNLH